MPWQFERDALALTGLGAADLLRQPLTAFFASRRCPGHAIRAATDWALHRARAGDAVVSGFHSPLEQSILRLLIEARSPAVVVLARPVATARLRVAWRVALDAGRLAIVSQVERSRRLTEDAAARRNDLAARLARHIVIAYAHPGGSLSEQCRRWAEEGLALSGLDGSAWAAA